MVMSGSRASAAAQRFWAGVGVHRSSCATHDLCLRGLESVGQFVVRSCELPRVQTPPSAFLLRVEAVCDQL